jgi:hypothetical protein
LSAAAAGLVAAAVFAAQNEPFTLTPVDPGVGDYHPLSVSLRVIDPGLQVPTGFEQVYRVPGRADRFMRIQGGVYAAFPASVYDEEQGRLLARVPPDTVFYIGEPAFEAIELEAARGSSAESGRRVVPSPAALAAAPLVEPQRSVLRIGVFTEGPSGRDDLAVALGGERSGRADGPAIVSDAEYRESRLAELLERAMTALIGDAGR